MLAGLIGLAACNPDSTQPEPLLLKIPFKASAEYITPMMNEGVQPSINTTTGDGEITETPNYNPFPQDAPKTNCWYNVITRPSTSFQQTETLFWDDNNHVPRKQVVSGKFKVIYQWYHGTYNGNSNWCILINQILLSDSTYEYAYKGGPHKSWKTPSGLGFSHCYGAAACANESTTAKVYVAAWFNFLRNCNIDRPDLAQTQRINLGTIPQNWYLQQNPEVSNHSWIYKIYAYKWDQPAQYAGGWWTATDYGGYAGLEYGFPQGQTLCSRYYDVTHPGALGQLGGHATWGVFNP